MGTLCLHLQRILKCSRKINPNPTLRLDNHHRSFWQLIDHTVRRVLALLSLTIDYYAFQLINVLNYVTIYNLLQGSRHRIIYRI